MKAIFYILLRVIIGIMGALLLWVSYQIFPFNRLGSGIYHVIFSFLIQMGFIYIAYELLVYVIGGKSLVKRIATIELTNVDVIRVLCRIFAGFMGLVALRLLYGQGFIPGEYDPGLYKPSGRYSGIVGLYFIVFICFGYAFYGPDLLGPIVLFGKPKSEKKNDSSVIEDESNHKPDI